MTSPLARPALEQTAGETPHLVVQVGVGHAATVGRVDERGLVAQLRGLREHERRERNLGDYDVGKRAVMDHGVILSQ